MKTEISVIITTGTVSYPFMAFNSHAEAVHFCEENGWKWVDENDFCWNLEIEGD